MMNDQSATQVNSHYLYETFLWVHHNICCMKKATIFRPLTELTYLPMTLNKGCLCVWAGRQVIHGNQLCWVSKKRLKLMTTVRGSHGLQFSQGLLRVWQGSSDTCGSGWFTLFMREISCRMRRGFGILDHFLHDIFNGVWSLDKQIG